MPTLFYKGNASYTTNGLKLDPSPNLSQFTGRGFELNFFLKDYFYCSFYDRTLRGFYSKI
jgi:hypothetical protein